MNKWLRGQETTWFAYLPPAALKTMVDDPGCHDLLLSASPVATKASSLKVMDASEKRLAVKAMVEGHRNQHGSLFHGLHPLEILAVLTRRALDAPTAREACNSVGPATLKRALWPSTKKEKALLAPVVAHYRAQGYEVYKEIRMARKRVDALCHRTKGGLLRSEKLVAIELKNDLAEFDRGMDQLTTFAGYAHSTYLACTPAFAFDYLDAEASATGVLKWDPKALETKLARAGLGLLIVRNDEVHEVLAPPKPSKIADDKRAEIAGHLVPRNVA
jgi:hypothetical protein